MRQIEPQRIGSICVALARFTNLVARGVISARTERALPCPNGGIPSTVHQPMHWPLSRGYHPQCLHLFKDSRRQTQIRIVDYWCCLGLRAKYLESEE